MSATIRALALSEARVEEAEEELEVVRREAFVVEQERLRREAARRRKEAEREPDAPVVPSWQQPEPSTFADWKARREGRLL